MHAQLPKLPLTLSRKLRVRTESPIVHEPLAPIREFDIFIQTAKTSASLPAHRSPSLGWPGNGGTPTHPRPHSDRDPWLQGELPAASGWRWRR